jgi:hypothetical protein
MLIVHRYTLRLPGSIFLVGVSSLAGGPDQLFARTVLDLGGTLEVVVPAEQYRDGLDPDEQHGYDELVAKAEHVERLPFVESTELAHLAAGQAVVDRSERLVAVWDGKPARGTGGTADIVSYAHQKGVPVAVLWPESATRESGIPLPRTSRALSPSGRSCAEPAAAFR